MFRYARFFVPVPLNHWVPLFKTYNTRSLLSSLLTSLRSDPHSFRPTLVPNPNPLHFLSHSLSNLSLISLSNRSMARGKRPRKSPTPSSSSYAPSESEEESFEAPSQASPEVAQEPSPVAASPSLSGHSSEESSSPSPPPPPPARPPPPTARPAPSNISYRNKRIGDPLWKEIRSDSWNNECFESYKTICEWRVLHNRFVDIDGIDASFPAANLEAIMATQGLTSFMKLKFPCYPTMVRRFYANLRVDNEAGTEASVRIKGIRININKANLCSWFNLKPTGRSILNRTYKSAGTTKKAIWTQLAGGADEYAAGLRRVSRNSTATYLPTQQCTREFRVLLLIMARTIIPKTGHFDEIREDTGLAVVDMASDVVIDWAEFIFHYLKHPPTKQLWFGNMVSKILELHNIPLAGESKEKQSSLTHTSLIKMGIIRSYMTVDVPQAPGEEGEEEAEGEEGDKEDDESDFDFTIPPEDEIQAFRDEVIDRLDAQDAHLVELKNQMAELKGDVASLHTKLDHLIHRSPSPQSPAS